MDEKHVLRAQETYRVNQIQTASREQLLLITYDIGIQACKTAEEALGRSDVEATNAALQRGQAVIRELMVTLNVEVGGDMARQLMGLYEFLFYELVQANIHKDVARVEGVRGMLQELRQTWQDAIEKLHAEEAVEEEHPAPARSVNVVAAGGRPLLQGGLNIAG